MFLAEDREECWRCKPFWKLKAPMKSRFFLWLALNNKFNIGKLAEKIMANTQFVCVLCTAEGESTKHLVKDCPFVKEVWKEVSTLTSSNGKWENFIVCWTICLQITSNKILFQDQSFSPLGVFYNIKYIYDDIKLVPQMKSLQSSDPPALDKSVAWG